MHVREEMKALSLIYLINVGCNFTAPLPPELLDITDDFLIHSASDGTIEENFEEELAKAPEVYAEVAYPIYFLFLTE